MELKPMAQDNEEPLNCFICHHGKEQVGEGEFLLNGEWVCSWRCRVKYAQRVTK